MNRKERRRQLKRDKTALRDDPAAGKHLQKARASLEAGDLATAEREFRAVIERVPKNAAATAEAFHMLALIAYQGGHLQEAGEMILEAITRNDDDPTIHANCGAIMNLLSRPMEAEAASRHAIQLKSDYAEAHSNLGVALEIQGRLAEALESAVRATELDPGYVEARINIGNIKMRMSDVPGAIETYKGAVKLAPDNSMARANLGAALREAGEWDAAEAECLRAIELSPKFPEAHNSLGNLLIAREDWEGAKAAFLAALDCRAGFLEAQINLAGAMFKAGELQDAETQYREILETHNGLAEAHAGLGVVLLTDGRLEDAVKSFREAVNLKPDLGQAQHNLATAVGKDMNEEEIAEIRELLSNKNLPEADRIRLQFALGEINDQKENQDAAFADFEAGNKLQKKQLTRAGRSFDADAFDKRVDGIISVYGAELLDGRKDGGDPTEQPVFIVGMPRSGTTLVEQVAASHADVAGKGELDLIRVLAGGDADFSEIEEKALAEKAAEYLARLRSGVEDAVRITDKMPFNFLYLGQIQLLFPGARIIHCRRDSLDTGFSCFRQYFTTPHAWACDLGDIGRFQRACKRLMAHWGEVLSLPIMEIDYEDMVGDQEKTSRRLIEFLGLDWDPACLDFHKSGRTVLTASNWQVRKPLYKTAIGRAGAYEKFLDPLKKGLGV